MFERQPWMYRAGEYPVSDQEYFALLARAVFSAGLGPRVVESRWAGLREAFHEFEPALVAGMTEEDVAPLLSNAAVIRNRRKMEAVIANAAVFLDVLAEAGSFHAYLIGLGVGENLEEVAEALAERFVHFGRTSALFFLFSAGWRTVAADVPPADTAEVTPGVASGEAPGAAKKARAPRSGRQPRVEAPAA